MPPIKEGDTVEVGTLLGTVNEGKSGLVKTTKKESGNQDQQSYIPPKTLEKKNIVKENIKTGKKAISKKKEALTLVDDYEDEDSNGALVLDTLADESTDETTPSSLTSYFFLHQR